MSRRPIRPLLAAFACTALLALCLGSASSPAATRHRVTPASSRTAARAHRRPRPTGADRALEARRLHDRLRRVEWTLRSERERLRIPGLAFALIEDDRVVMLTCLGVRDLATRRPVDSLTLFPVGSCTKAFTAMAAEISQQDGTLSLDEHPQRYLPWFHMADPEANRLVTLRDMLSHRTGLKAYADLAAEPGVLSRLDYVRAATAARPAVPFRETFQYSNAMYVAVGEIVAKVQRSTWEQVIEQRVFAPLGMTSSITSLDDLPRHSDHAIGYDDPRHTGDWHPAPPPASLHALAPAGAIASNARDMARWIRFLLGQGAIDGHRVVSPNGVREVMTAHTPINASLSYGLGWALYDWNRHQVVEHNGGSQGISALVSMMPERRIGFVLLANVTPTSLTKIGVLGRMLWPILLGERGVGGAPEVPSHRAPPTPTPPDSAYDTSHLPPVDEILSKMLAAAGGGRSLRADTTLELRCRKSYLNQGVDADVRTRWKMPDRIDSDERWSAAGKPIGGVRSYVNGARSGQETTFGQDEIYSGDTLAGARRDASLAWLLDPRGQYPRIKLLGRRRLAGEDVYVLELSPVTGEPTLYSVSARSFLVAQKKSGASVETYSDYRTVGGRAWPYRTLIADALGDAEVTVRSIRWGVPVADDAFAPRVATAASPAPSAP